MKIKIYVSPNADPRALAESVRQAVEAQTDKPCIVKIVADPTRPVVRERS